MTFTESKSNKPDSLKVEDQAVRDELLDISKSYIVQAPAGSGKTELLTQRILKLLTVVDKPENVLALTFTRKAAAEMRERVVDALKLAKEKPPKSSHELNRYQLAQLVLKTDQKRGWNIIENPSRLNLLTIDSLASSLSGALPILSQTGTVPSVEENAMPLYIEAAERLLDEIDHGGAVSQNIKIILRHKDNNLKQVLKLIAELLSKRLYWLGKDWMNQPTGGLSRSDKRNGCESSRNKIWESIEVLTEDKLREAYELIPTDILAELPPLLRQVSEVLGEENDNTGLMASEKLDEPIGLPSYTDHQLWLAIANLFLKKGASTPSLFVSLNKTQGFPTKNDAVNDIQAQQFELNKATILSILKDLANHEDHHRIVDLLDQIRQLPIETNDTAESFVLNAITELLPVAAGYLKLVFKERNVVDFTELSISSLEALGSEESPSDYALALDHKVKHILVDEFQDTSSPQIRLIELLIAGWDESEDRSLFLVGDPMQSIYRFRDANVSLFLKVVENGIGQLRPLFRRLETNFRSEKAIIDWVNYHFQKLMPEESDVTFSAVKYSDSIAFHPTSSTSKVNTMLTLDADNSRDQAEQVVRIIELHIEENRQRKRNGSESVKTLAVLGKNRSHLREVIRLLNSRAILFQAVEIELLSESIVVQDLISLALALTDTYNQQAWVSCLRSPWYGLTMADINFVVDRCNQWSSDIPSVLTELCNAYLADEDNKTKEAIAESSLHRIKKIQPILNFAISHKGKKPFRKWLMGTFEAIGGMFQLDHISDFNDLNSCIDTIAAFEDGGEISDIIGLNAAIKRLYAAPNPLADPQVQIMTIHKSKGLEFDLVIIPHIDSWRKPPDAPLLRWSEVVDKRGESHHMLAVSRAIGKEQSGLYQFISSLEKRKNKYESQRLFYVAATRAKSELYLLGNIESDPRKSKEGSTVYKMPTAGSFLSLIWKELDSAPMAANKLDNKSETSNDSKFSIIPCIKTSDENELSLLPKNLTENELSEIKTLDDDNKQIMAIFPSRKIKRVFIDKISKVPQEYALSATKPVVLCVPQQTENNKEVDSELDHNAIAVGNVIHLQLEWLSNLFSRKNFKEEQIINFKLPDHWYITTKAQLAKELQYNRDRNKSVEDGLSELAERVIKAIENTLGDPDGRFILSHHENAQSEQILQNVTSDNKINRSVIDRTFTYNNSRWIVDYKSAQPKTGESLKSFIKRETQSHFKQLNDYATLFQKVGEIDIITALYFPMIPHLEIVESSSTDTP